MNVQTPNARRTDPITSHLAGDYSTQSGRRQCQIELVSSMVKEAEGFTSAELAKYFKEDRAMIARRLPNAMDVKKVAIRKCRVSGRKCVTWVTK